MVCTVLKCNECVCWLITDCKNVHGMSDITVTATHLVPSVNRNKAVFRNRSRKFLSLTTLCMVVSCDFDMEETKIVCEVTRWLRVASRKRRFLMCTVIAQRDV